MNRKHVIWTGILVAILPLFFSLNTMWFIAGPRGCSLSGPGHNFCIVGNINYGPLLYYLFYFGFFAVPIGGAIAAFGFIKKSKQTTDLPTSSLHTSSTSFNSNSPIQVVAPGVPSMSGESKRLIWIGLLFIFLHALLGFLLIYIFPTLYPLLYIPLGFVKFFGVPLGIVLLIAGIVKHFSSQK